MTISNSTRSAFVIIANSGKFEAKASPRARKTVATPFQIMDNGERVSLTHEQLLDALKGQSRAAFGTKPSSDTLSVNFALRAPRQASEQYEGYFGLAAGIEVNTANYGVVAINLSKLVGIIAGGWVPVSDRAPRLRKELALLDTLPQGEGIVYAIGVNRVLGAEARTVRKWTNGEVEANYSAMTADEAEANGFSLISRTVQPTDVQAYSGEWLLANAGICVGREGVDEQGRRTVSWFGFLSLQALAALVTGSACSLPRVQARTNTEVRQRRAIPVRVANDDIPA